MNIGFFQADRLGRLTTELGPDALVLLRFEGTDYLNDLFEYNVEALADTPSIDFDKLIGTHATVTLEGRDAPQEFDGIVSRIKWVGVGENGHRYNMTLRPWFWLAGRRTNQRIFHEKTVVEILSELFADYAALGDPVVEFDLSEDYPTLEYTVQYRESDLNFARRQMERHGISFHFKHKNGSHTMVLTDDPDGGHESIGARPFLGVDGQHQADQEHFWEWAPERNLTTGATRLIDYNFKSPTAFMEADALGDAVHAFGQLESYEYPGDFADLDTGAKMAQRRLKQFRGGDYRNRAVGDCLSLKAGKLVDLTGDPVLGTGQTYMCLVATHNFKSEAYGSTGSVSKDYSYAGNYVLMPKTAAMVPPRRTPPPVVEGPQTAVVVGEDEIDCDKYGRILVRFHWDLANARSMRCRVSQNWAGNGLGGVVIPRVGMEVVVDFIDGSPDKPIVTGCVVNGANGNIYGLPGGKTKSGFKTKTHNGSGSNELSFEDAGGSEQIFVHAEKDLNRVIRNDESTLLESGNRMVTVQTGTETKTVKGDRTITVQTGNEATTIETGNRSVTVKTGDESTTVETGNRNVTVKTGDESTTVETGNRGVTVTTGDETKTIGSGNLSEKVALTRQVDATTIVANALAGDGGPGVISYSADDKITMNSTKLLFSHAGEIAQHTATDELKLSSKLITGTAEDKITLQVGSSSITLAPDGIVLQHGGTIVTLAEGVLDQVAGVIHLNKDSGS